MPLVSGDRAGAGVRQLRRRWPPAVTGTTLAVVAALLAACSNSPVSTTGGSGSPAATVTIAVEGPMSGLQGDIGADMLRGAKLAATNLNARGGVLGKEVDVVPADDDADPSKGAATAHRVVGEGARGVVGPFDSAVGVKALPIYRSSGLPVVRLTSSTSTEGFGVTTQPMQRQIAPVEAQAMTQFLHATSVAILYDPSTYTAAVAHQLQGELQAAGVQVPVLDSVSPSGTPKDQLQRLNGALEAAANARPSVTYLAMYGTQAGKAVSLMGGQAAYGRCFVDVAAQGIDFTLGAGPLATGCLSSGVPPPNQLPRGAEYVARYEQTFHSAPGIWGPFAYDSVEVLAQAARRAHSWSGGPVRHQLGQVQDPQGMTGVISFTMPSGNRVEPPVVILDTSAAGDYRVDPAWAATAGYQLP